MVTQPSQGAPPSKPHEADAKLQTSQKLAGMDSRSCPLEPFYMS